MLLISSVPDLTTTLFSIYLSSIAKELRVLETRQNSPNANKENVKPIEASASITRSIGKGVYLWRCHAIYHLWPAVFNLNFEAFAKAVFCCMRFCCADKARRKQKLHNVSIN